MNRTNIYLSDEQKERLLKESERVGLSVSEIIRRAIDSWLDHKEHPLNQVLEKWEGYAPSTGEYPLEPGDELLLLVDSIDKRLDVLLKAQPPEILEKIERLQSE